MRQGSLRHRGSFSSGGGSGGGGLGPGGVYDGSDVGSGLGPGGVYDGSSGQPIYINEDRIDAISVQSNVISNRLLHLANESGTPTDEEDTPNANGSNSGHGGPTGQSPLLFEVVDSNENGSGKACYFRAYRSMNSLRDS